MQAVNEARWSETQASLRSEDVGSTFLDFFEFWFDAAETLMFEGTGGQPSPPEPNMPATEAMRQALTMAEETLGFITVDWVGQMLCVASMHWEQGKEMAEGMTPIEIRVMETALAMKISQLQESAGQ